MKKKTTIVLISTFINLLSFGQTPKDSTKFKYKDDLSSIFKLGYSYQKNHFIEAGYGYGIVLNNRIAPTGIITPFIQLEYSPTPINPIFGQKIGFECSLWLLSSKVSFVRYAQNNTAEYILTPEIGLTLFSIITLTYGYNINTSARLLNDIGANRLSVGLNYSPHYGAN